MGQVNNLLNHFLKGYNIMVPLLPFNSWTISPINYSSEMELERLRRLDTYFRTTSIEREERKVELEKLIGLKNPPVDVVNGGYTSVEKLRGLTISDISNLIGDY